MDDILQPDTAESPAAAEPADPEDAGLELLEPPTPDLDSHLDADLDAGGDGAEETVPGAFDPASLVFPAAIRHRAGDRAPRGRRFWLTLAAALLTLAGTAVALTVIYQTHRPAPGRGTPPPRVAVQHPDDGTLTVGTATVTQIAGTCAGAQCTFPAAGAPPVVHASTGALPLHAAKSTAFPGVSAFNVANPAAAAPFTAAGGQLRFPAAAPGTYRVTVIGNAGGTWQFTVVIDAAHR